MSLETYKTINEVKELFTVDIITREGELLRKIGELSSLKENLCIQAYLEENNKTNDLENHFIPLKLNLKEELFDRIKQKRNFK